MKKHSFGCKYDIKVNCSRNAWNLCEKNWI